MMPKPHPDTVARFDAAIPDAPGVARRLMFGQPSAFVNGNMFMGLFGEDMLLRLSPADREEMTALGGGPFEPMGRPMKEYVTVAAAVRDDPDALSGWVQRALALAAALPPRLAKPRRAAPRP
jgi:TfoX/Sxy family transcriptional regulator of competence genes